MHVFSAASSIEKFTIWVGEEFEPDVKPGFPTSEAFGCFGSLRELRSLVLLEDFKGYFPCIDLLAGLPSTSLTSLELHVHALHVPLTHQIARFHDLQELVLEASSADAQFLAPLFDLKCLTLLKVSVDPVDDEEYETDALPAIRAQAARLNTAVRERAREVGVKAEAEVFYSGG